MGEAIIRRFQRRRAAALLLLCLVPAGAARGATVEAVNDGLYAPRALELIGGARDTLRLAIFQVRYYPRYPQSPANRLLEALIAAAGRGVDVRVCVDNTDAAHLRENNAANLEVARRLAAGGVTVFLSRAESTMHAKFLVADRQALLLGSANWSFYALGRNREANLLVRCPETAARFDDYFAALEEEGRPLPREQ